MISESYRARIQELAGILTEDSSDRLKKFGIKDDVAEYLVGIDDKLSLFLANITLRDFAKESDIESENIKEIIPIINQTDYLDYLEKNKEKLNYILEWAKSPFRVGELNLKDITSFAQAFEMADQWHHASEGTGIIQDESGEVVKTYPKDGYYWIDLKTNSSQAEADAMGHCGTDGRATTIFSLRDVDKSPHVTIAYNADTKTVTQVKGRKNERPLPEYMKYAYDFLKDMVNKGEFKNISWSYTPHGTDLTPEEIKYIFGGDFSEYVESMLQRNLIQKVYIPLPFSFKEIIDNIGREKFGEYVKKFLERNMIVPTFRFKMKKNETIGLIGEDGYRNYLVSLINKTIEDPAFNSGLSRDEIIGVIGEEKYKQYVDALLRGVMEDPVHKTVSLTKDEMFATLGQEGYKNFKQNLVKSIVDSPSIKTERMLQYVLKKHGFEMSMEQIKSMVGSKSWFFFIKRANEFGKSNLYSGFD